MRVLIAEDEVVSRKMLEAMLGKWGFEPVVVTNGADALKELDGFDAPRLALLDWMMTPGPDGVEICRLLRLRTERPYVYVLLVTARTEKQDLLEALAAGADDYLTKPFDAGELRARLLAGQRIVQLQDELIAARETQRFQANHDALTGLYSRPEILRILEREIQRCQRQISPLGVAMADLDHFKAINDLQGHLAGDMVLREVTRRMTRAVRSYDSLGRYGGEEFLIVSPAIDEAGLGVQCERMRAAVASEPILAGAGSLQATISIGAFVGSPDSLEPERLLLSADLALYRAKELGRNRFEISSKENMPPPETTEDRAEKGSTALAL
jgi:two-component system cell cycle response regulator